MSVAYKNKLDEASGRLHIISTSDYEKLENVIEAIPNLADNDKLHLVGNILSHLDAESSSFTDFVNVLQTSNSETISHIAAASKMIEYSKAVGELKDLVEGATTLLQYHY